MISTGAMLNERFTLNHELGQGGMGTVYQATDQLLGRTVAIKLLKDRGDELDAEQMRLEAQILARLVHDHIVRLYDFGEAGGNQFLVMEEVNGPSFARRWQELPLHDRLRVCGQVARALDYAHFQGVIHRDIKPGNVLLTASDEAKLSDFGLSLVAAEGRAQSGTVRGTPRYMSPEQAEGKRLDHRTDLYSMGVMLYECATGVVPFVGSAMSVMGQHVRAVPPAPREKNPQITSTLESLILSLLEKNPGKRPASGNVVALALVDEAERARRLDRINMGHRRSPPQSSRDRPDSETLSSDELKTGSIPANASRRVDEGKADGLPTEPPPEVVHGRVAGSGSARANVADEAWSRSGHVTTAQSKGQAVAQEMIHKVLDAPLLISPEERYLCGHYLAYLLGGSRRRGLFFRRTVDAKNADRARLLLAMTWLCSIDPTDQAIERASNLLEDRPDVRAALSPMMVIKYLESRDTAGKRRRFRQVRKRLQEKCAYARKNMLDANGVINPGMMPRDLDDLAKVAPPLETLDAHRVSLWNRLADVWREDAEFRRAVLRYATKSEQMDGPSAQLWPEVVYPLIERAHWQRKFRPRYEVLWDYVVGKVLHVPVRGVRLDQMMVVAIPVEVAEQFNVDLSSFVDAPVLEEDEAEASQTGTAAKRRPFYVGATIPVEKPEVDEDAVYEKVLIPLVAPDPIVFTQTALRNLWEGAMEAQATGARPGAVHRTIPVGQYELAVVPTGRGKSAVRAVLKGMPAGKLIEMFTPLTHGRETTARPVIAIWTYQEASMAVVHLDFQFKERYILWHAPDAQQFNFDYREELRQRLATVNLEVPPGLDQALIKKEPDTRPR